MIMKGDLMVGRTADSTIIIKSWNTITLKLPHREEAMKQSQAFVIRKKRHLQMHSDIFFFILPKHFPRISQGEGIPGLDHLKEFYLKFYMFEKNERWENESTSLCQIVGSNLKPGHNTRSRLGVTTGGVGMLHTPHRKIFKGSSIVRKIFVVCQKNAIPSAIH